MQHNVDLISCLVEGWSEKGREQNKRLRIFMSFWYCQVCNWRVKVGESFSLCALTSEGQMNRRVAVAASFVYIGGGLQLKWLLE